MCVGGIMATLSDLPDLVLLEIFSYLPVRDRIRLSRCGLAPRLGGREGKAGQGRGCSNGILLLQGLSPLEEAGERRVAVATH